ncbi:MAG: hypothetical protein J6L85_08230, partial [Clostridia bacterium]|nr:hypothetical protein [Clostridia bacterium]
MKISIKSALRLACGVLLLSLLAVGLSSCSQKDANGMPISTGINVICEESFMAKSALKGESISFSPEDFARAVNLESIDSITVTSLPPLTDGELRVGSTVLTGGQKLSAASVSLMTYAPSSSITSSEFKF